MKKINLSFKNRNSDFLNYCPFRLGLKQSELGLRKLNPSPDEDDDVREKLFQIDPSTYELYLKSKRKMKELHPDIAYQRSKSMDSEDRQRHVFNYMAANLAKTYPEYFQFDSPRLTYKKDGSFSNYDQACDSHLYQDGLDFLAHHIQEDFCLVHVETLKAELIHLCSPNDWTAKWGLNKNFDEIHVHAPRAMEIVKRPEQIFRRLYENSVTYERLGAMTLTSFPYLIRHPDHIEEPIESEKHPFFFRFERQTLSKIPHTPYLLFTIRPYLMDFTQELPRKLSKEQWEVVSAPEHKNRYNWFFRKNFTYLNQLFLKSTN